METLPNPVNLAFVEDLYATYRIDPTQVSAQWRRYFEALEKEQEGGRPGGAKIGPSFKPTSIFSPVAAPTPGNGQGAKIALESASRQDRLDLFIRNFRVRGHRVAEIDPLGLPKEEIPELDYRYHGFTDQDLDRSFSTMSIQGPNIRSLREIISTLRNTYCRSIGVQFMHIDDLEVRLWLQERMEAAENRITLSRKEQVRIFTKLTDAVTFEQFIQKKFIGAKSFSLQGAESLIPLLDLAIERAGRMGVQEVVLGMAHRGRLNVLANIMSKHPREIFREFADIDSNLYEGGGDVKYHLGYSSDWQTSSGQPLHLTLCFNPSHLEFINPVALGRVRAKQDRFADAKRERCLALLIHGDASFAGEGVVQETLNLSQLAGYNVGGTLHVVINNQIGFTTGPQEGRSTTYATDIARMLQIPIFHVNGEDPEAVAQVVHLALDFRKAFQRDVVIDMYCFRRFGHNESDEPSFTQPLLYRAIEARKSVREGYLEHLLTLGGITRQEADRIAEERRAQLETELSVAQSQENVPKAQTLAGFWSGYVGGPEKDAPQVATNLDRKGITDLLTLLTKLPENFTPHAKIDRFLKNRLEMARGEKPLDWSAGEALALASLLVAGHRVRLSGQDTERGTFSHRHAVLHDFKTGAVHCSLQHLSFGQAPVEICNSPLSEVGVLGFEYGYSLDCPEGLIVWEAQFGDFVNVAQVMIDQFLASAEAKWRRLSGLVLLLPHGFEGQGPEHSSARLERFLTMAAQDNMQVTYPTTPAQYFHLLRRQVLRPWRKPLVVMTPKSLLRNPQAVSSLEELSQGAFQPILKDSSVDPAQVNRVIFCSGKIYYELAEERKNRGRRDVAIHRLEQIYPLQLEQVAEVLKGVPQGVPVFWVQEEPENMGAWRFLLVRFGTRLLERYPFGYIGRPEASTPATGSMTAHKVEQKKILDAVFGI